MLEKGAQKLLREVSKLVSVIVPVYKVEEYICRCVDSILNQTYQNLEVLLVDDGNTDRCGDICEGYARVDARVKVIHQENGGVSVARNVGLDACSGEYIVFVDSDDYISSDIIARLVASIGDADWASCGYSRVDNEDKVIYNFSVDEEITLCGIDLLNMHYGLVPQHSGISSVYVTGRLYKRDVWRDVRFPVRTYFEDICVMPYILMNAKKVVFTPGVGYYYRMNPNSITNNTSKEHKRRLFLDSFYIWDKHLSLYNEHAMHELVSAVECLKVEKIIAHSLVDDIPSDLVSFTKKTLRSSVWFLLRQKIRTSQKLRYLIFLILGKHSYKMIQRIMN